MPIQINEVQLRSALTTSDADAFLFLQTKRAGRVKGESTAPGHEDDIVVSTWTWGVAASSAIGSTQATGRRAYKNLTITKAIDAASTPLLSVLSTNDEVKEARLSLRKAGEGQQDYFTIKLEKARVIAVDLEGDPNGGTLERVTLSFNKVSVEYRLQQGGGGRGAATTFEDEI